MKTELVPGSLYNFLWFFRLAHFFPILNSFELLSCEYQKDSERKTNEVKEDSKNNNWLSKLVSVIMKFLAVRS